jgi:hypothetical protein
VRADSIVVYVLLNEELDLRVRANYLFVAFTELR